MQDPHDQSPPNPAQQAVLDELGATGGERPVFDEAIGPSLRHALESELDRVVASEPLHLNKQALADVHGCEARYVAVHHEPFAWSVPLARGTITHKAIELSVHWRGDVTPLDLVDEAIASLTEGDSSIGDWLRTVSDRERAELRGEVNDLLVSFLDCWPPLKKRWWPVLEGRTTVELSGGMFVLRGRPDLALGRPDPPRASKVLVDLKTGTSHDGHRDDLRFYAVLETIKTGIPPRRLATSYLDQGRLASEPVTEDMLWATMARIADGARRAVELLQDRAEPVRKPGPRCRWCPARLECSEGQAWLAAAEEP